MIRIKISILLALFMLLGYVRNIDIAPNFTWPLLFGFVALVNLYGFATSVNDLADVEIDRVNLKNDKERLLANGYCDSSMLIILSVNYALISLMFASFVSFESLILVFVGLIMGFMYSMKPFEFSHKPIIASFFLALCYVVLPYWIGLNIAKGNIDYYELIFVFSLYLIFVSRICLKDFRDRKGDLLNNKNTFLLVYGKKVTVIFSIGTFLAGVLILFVSQLDNLLLIAVISPFVVALSYERLMILKASSHMLEQKYIGMEQKIGVGMFILMLGYFTLKADYVSFGSILSFCLFVDILYAYLYLEASKKYIVAVD